MQKLKMHTPNLTTQNLEKIKALFPNCITESLDDNGALKLAIDFDLLKQELSEQIIDGPQERYQLNWPGKREALLTANAPINKTLRPAFDESVDFENTKNLFIEGDNLEALKLLQETYLGKVKMIYIDPPYNTGKDFIYQDNFTQNTADYLLESNQKDEEGNRFRANTESNGRFHSDWLSFIYPRLKLAHNLLADDGVIFISIDDNEQANLKKLCDEVFGEENSLINSIWCKGNAQNDADYIQKNHEYILAYKKQDLNLKEKKTSVKRILYEGDKCFYLGSGIVTGGAGGTLKNRLNLGYSIYVNPNTGDFIACDDYDKDLAKVSDDESMVYKNNLFLIEKGYTNIIRPPKKGKSLGCWTWNIEKFNNEKESIFISDNNSIYKKIFVEKHKIKNDTIEVIEDLPPSSIISFSSSESSKWLNQELGHKIFDNPKPLSLIKRMLKISTSHNDLILDFFAGSSTTAHAVMQLNAEDGGNRQFIMVQLPEKCDEKSESYKAGYKNIAEISKERIRRAGKKILEGDCHEGWNKDIGFRVLKIDDSNFTDVYYEPSKTTQADLLLNVNNIKNNRTKEDLLFQTLLDLGVDLTLPITKKTLHHKTIFLVNADKILGEDRIDLIACFDNGINEDLIKEIAKLQPLKVVFKDNGFVSDAIKINVVQIFKQISPNTEVKAI